jgi:hypothetical protein
VLLAPAPRLLLEQCAAAAGTTAEDRATTLIMRDAHAQGLLHAEALPVAPTRRSLIEPIGDDELSRFAIENPCGSC